MGDRYKVDHRAALFGSRFGGAKSSQPPRSEGSAATAHAAQAAEVIEQQNDAQIAELGAKVAELKDITKGIAKEAQDSHGILGALGLSFDKAGGMMRSTLDQLTQATKRKDGRMCLTVALCLGLFLAMYLLASMGPRLRGGGGDGTLELRQNATAP